jgi:hypothetical protein
MSFRSIFARVGSWMGWSENGSAASAALTPAIALQTIRQSLAVAPTESQVVLPLDQDENALLDDLFRATVAYRKSKAYLDLLNYLARFRRYSIYNCFLVRLQRPTVGYVATPLDWMREFERRVKPDARPLVMLRPFGPVMFVFDIADTAGKEAPSGLMNPFDAKGLLNQSVWDYTVSNAAYDRIAVMPRGASLKSAGSAKRISPPAKGTQPNFEVVYNSNQPRAEAYVTLVHELAHIYCGHLGECATRRIPDRGSLPPDVAEFEAESVAYIVCARRGLVTTAPKYLAMYLGAEAEVPPIDIHCVLTVASRIEEMGKTEKKRKEEKESPSGVICMPSGNMKVSF